MTEKKNWQSHGRERRKDLKRRQCLGGRDQVRNGYKEEEL